MVATEREKRAEMQVALKRAVEFHGHLCPFLALGVRVGLIGVREMEAKRDTEDLRVTLMLQNPAAYPCFTDGIQVTTKCTIENKKLRLKVLKNLSATAVKFERPNKGQVTVSAKPTSFNALIETMKKVMSENFPQEKVQQLVQHVVSAPEEELFTIRKT